MISIIEKVFTEYSPSTYAAMNRADKSQTGVPQRMLKTALRMRSGTKRNSIVKGAKNLLNKNPSNRPI